MTCEYRSVTTNKIETETMGRTPKPDLKCRAHFLFVDAGNASGFNRAKTRLEEDRQVCTLHTTSQSIMKVALILLFLLSLPILAQALFFDAIFSIIFLQCVRSVLRRPTQCADYHTSSSTSFRASPSSCSVSHRSADKIFYSTTDGQRDNNGRSP